MIARRHQVHQACQRCRGKRIKCDGGDPCQKCSKAQQECVFDHSRRETKGELRAQIEHLKRQNEENAQLLSALSTADKTQHPAAAPGRARASPTKQTQPTQQVPASAASQEPDGHGKQEDDGRHSPSTRRPSQTESSTASSSEEVLLCPHCHKALPWSLSRSIGIGRAGDVDSAPLMSTPGSPFECSIPLNIHERHEPEMNMYMGPHVLVDGWTSTGWTVTDVRSLLDKLAKWDYLSFCLLSRQAFLHDYHSGSSRYCSSALVNALLALAVRVVDERQDEDTAPSRPGVVSSRDLFDEAEGIIRSDAVASRSLPGIQTLGVLALYQISCGKQAEARKLADAFADGMKNLRRRARTGGSRNVNKGDEEEEHSYARVLTETYRGAIFLMRILWLTTGQLPDGPYGDSPCPDDGVFLDQPSSAGLRAPASGRDGEKRQNDANESPRDGLLLIPAKIFQLTEWVYKLLVTAHVPSAEILAVYTKCLDWYDSFFALLAGGSDRPVVPIVHMYYQFCLLCLFRPFANMSLSDGDIEPRVICLQAAHSTLVLAQSYRRLFTLRRVSVFLPLFVCASGHVSLVEGNGGSPIRPICRPMTLLDSDAEAEPSEDPAKAPCVAADPTMLEGVMPSKFARMLLDEMRGSHPAAAMAAGILAEMEAKLHA
ncbi:hypothetical protein DCS_04000 [Drechmeria coniospora]|uniref:Zn(2)-C6 fungal-type domain-containing protein n=1 Tax=Drechmeria coniospora TaxID=98403 RepID=A0A151GIP5_DRECN|nr:hypothetical protein DCS_04000 [Drechmeria coniospora]KYK56993.1 hypothetical protein DCS_04000 [Drechmeria coniospora]ODA78270.1 hypothetical protein RJ55_05651 [Drechmeria coniospora]